MFPSKEHKKIHFGGSLSATKCYPYKARARNLSTISPTRNVVCTYTCVYTYAYSRNLEKTYRFFLFLKAFSLLNQDKYFALYWCFCARISVILLLIVEWNGSECKATDLGWDQANSNSILEYMSRQCLMLTFLDTRQWASEWIKSLAQKDKSLVQKKVPGEVGVSFQLFTKTVYKSIFMKIQLKRQKE